MKVAENQIYKNKNGKVIRITDCFGNNRYCLLDKNGNYIREIPSIFNVKSMKELFPNLAR